MDSQDSSAPPPHHPQPPFPANHAMLMGQYNPIQQHPSNNSYPLPNSNNSVAPTNSSAPSSAMMHQQNPRFPLNSVTVAAAAQKPMDHQYSDGSPSGSGGAWFNIEPAKKKRGRPRKYSHDNSIGLGLSAAPVTQVPSAAGHLDSGSGGGIPASETPNKRHRGRPSGSVKRQLDALGVPGIGFTPHVITVNSGEDIASKIMAFSQQGPRTVCILSATGAICNVTLRQPATSGGIVTYEGRFEIISLSGSFMVSESNGSQSGSLTVSLAGSDGRVLGGGVVGMLKAASPVQIVVGSFIAEGGKKSKAGPSPTPPSNMLNFATPGTRGSPCTPGGSSDSEEDNDDDDGSPLDHPGPGPYANAGQAVHDVPIYSSMGWPNPIKMHPN